MEPQLLFLRLERSMIMAKRSASQAVWMKMGEVTQKLYDTLTGIQMGHIEGPEGWVKVIK